MISATGAMLEPAMLMSRMAMSKKRFCQSPRVFDIASLGNNAVPKLFDHFGKHHPDQGFIFDQEYGCFSEHVSGRLWSYRKRFCSSRKRVAHPVHRRMIRFFTLVGSMGLREPLRNKQSRRMTNISRGLSIFHKRESRERREMAKAARSVSKASG
jgi:hypothetical protein